MFLEAAEKLPNNWTFKICKSQTACYQKSLSLMSAELEKTTGQKAGMMKAF